MFNVSQRTKELALIGLGGSGDKRGEVLDGSQVVGGPQHCEVPIDVQPLVRRAADGTVIEVEAINVDDGSPRRGYWKVGHKGERRPYRPPGPGFLYRGES